MLENIIQKLFPKWYLKNKIYPMFIKKVQHCFSENKAIFLFRIDDNQLTIISIFNQHMNIFTKVINHNLIYTKYVLEKEFDLFSQQVIDITEFKNLILLLKEKGETVESSQIIDFLNNNLKNMISYYSFSRLEIEKLYKTIVIDNINFYAYNIAPIVLNTSANNWID